MATMNMETREVPTPASTEAPSGFIQKLYDLVNSGEETIGVSKATSNEQYELRTKTPRGAPTG